MLKLPIVYTYHTSYEDYTYYVTRGIMDRFAKRVVRTYSKNLANRMTEFITPSEKTKEYMRLVGSDIYINVIPTGIDFSIFRSDKIDQQTNESEDNRGTLINVVGKVKDQYFLRNTTRIKGNPVENDLLFESDGTYYVVLVEDAIRSKRVSQ